MSFCSYLALTISRDQALSRSVAEPFARRRPGGGHSPVGARRQLLQPAARVVVTAANPCQASRRNPVRRQFPNRALPRPSTSSGLALGGVSRQESDRWGTPATPSLRDPQQAAVPAHGTGRSSRALVAGGWASSQPIG